jgi:hypothetical protein
MIPYEVLTVLTEQWKRELKPHVGDIYALYLEDGLTGFVLYADPPVIQKFNGMPCVCVSLTDWLKVRELGNATVTPFRVLAKGKGLIAKAFAPSTGLKYPVRDVSGEARVFIPVEDFDSV